MYLTLCMYVSIVYVYLSLFVCSTMCVYINCVCVFDFVCVCEYDCVYSDYVCACKEREKEDKTQQNEGRPSVITPLFVMRRKTENRPTEREREREREREGSG